MQRAVACNGVARSQRTGCRENQHDDYIVEDIPRSRNLVMRTGGRESRRMACTYERTTRVRSRFLEKGSLDGIWSIFSKSTETGGASDSATDSCLSRNRMTSRRELKEKEKGKKQRVNEKSARCHRRKGSRSTLHKAGNRSRLECSPLDCLEGSDRDPCASKRKVSAKLRQALGLGTGVGPLGFQVFYCYYFRPGHCLST